MSAGCCTKSKPCDIGGGYCGSDDHCGGNLVCGTANCQDFHSGAPANL